MEPLALHGGPAAKTRPFPDWPTWDDRELDLVRDVVKSGRWWRNAGDAVERFEEEFARYQGGRAALGVTNGTQAIELLLQALDVGRGDEVVVPAFTFVSTAVAVLNVNAVPVFADVDPVTYCLDPDSFAAAVTSRTRAVLPVHMAGAVADLDRILDVARPLGIHVVEDAAHGQGAEWRGRRVGVIGAAGIFSFQQGKLMTAGEGGLILSDDPELVERCYLYGNCGRPRADRTYQHALLGTNSRMSEFQGALLRAQLSRLDEQIARREVNAPRLDERVRSVPGLKPQGSDPRGTRNPHYMYMFRYDPNAFDGLCRNAFVDHLNAEGVPAFVAYPAVHRTPAFRDRAFGPRWRHDLPDYGGTRCPVSEDLGERGVWLHHRTLLGDQRDLDEILLAIRKIRRHAAALGATA
jgi:3-amino-5-hydroxybenzoate synthase